MSPLKDVTATFMPGVATAVTGPSGSGKSTLLRVLAGLQQVQRGAVALNGQALRPSKDATVHEDVSMVHQDLRLIDFLDVRENLELARDLRGHRGREIGDIDDVLDSVGLHGFSRRRPGTLSGGEQQRVAIARALLLRSRVLLADEPTGALDETNSIGVAQLLHDAAHLHGVVVVVATHDPEVARMMPAHARLQGGALKAAA